MATIAFLWGFSGFAAPCVFLVIHWQAPEEEERGMFASTKHLCM